MTKLYSYLGSEPSPLPERLVIPADISESGQRETRTHLYKYSEKELEELGLIDVEVPKYNKDDYDCFWNSEESKYDLVEIDGEEKASRAFVPEVEKVADWVDFEDRFPHLKIYKKLFASEIPFLIKFICEVRVLFLYARYKDPRASSVGVFNLQQAIDVLSVIKENGITEEDRQQFLAEMRLSNLDVEATNIPNKQWREHHTFEISEDYLKHDSSMHDYCTYFLKADDHIIE